MASGDDEPTPESFFRGFPDGLALFDAAQAAVAAAGAAEVRVTKSQIAQSIDFEAMGG